MLDDHLTRGLCCAALNPGLGSVLIFDLQPNRILDVAGVFSQMISAASGEQVTQVLLNSVESEDRLWGSFGLPDQNERTPLIWQSGLLSPTEKEDGIRLVVIHDLERINLPVARALVTMIGAEVAHLERYGKRHQWLPKFFWLAGCQGDSAGKISLHLLDRFALRLQSPGQSRPRAEDLLSWLSRTDGAETPIKPAFPETLSRQLRLAAQLWPSMTDEALERVLEYETTWSNARPRRSFALSRLGHTLARLSNADKVGGGHIDEAADLIGLLASFRNHQQDKTHTASESSVPSDTDEKSLSERKAYLEKKDEISPPLEEIISPDQDAQLKSVEQDVTTSPVTELPAAMMELPIDPYREDEQPVEREAASLRLPFQRSSQISATRGSIIGTQPARALRDLALVNTLFESAKFQSIRRRSVRRQSGQTNDNRLLIAPSDLRSYRRAPIPEKLLMLLLDHTCLDGRFWLESLLPYFKQAYVDRARICFIQVGAATAAHLLRADRHLFNNVLVPSLADALDASPGKATPLAHGLDLAIQTLRHALQHGRQMAHSVRLIVISDGRGNVPLSASVVGQIEHPVGREGIEDALLSARKLRAMDRVEIIFLDPQPSSHVGLVSSLADALGAAPWEIPLMETPSLETEEE